MASTIPSSSLDQDDDDDLPECPVCLQLFDPISAVPRVLPCGHSICHVCLPLLPPPLASLPNSLRCPSCTQLVPFDRQVGPASLPKNLDLLHFISPNGDKPSIRTEIPASTTDKVDARKQKPLLWSHQNLLSFWKNFVLPENLVTLGEQGDGIIFGRFGATIGSPWFCKEKQRVSLLQVKTESFVDGQSEWFRPSYIYRMMDAIEKSGDKAREELGFLLEASSRVPYGICKAYGLWLGLNEDQNLNLYLVSERYDQRMEFSLKPMQEDSIYHVGIACMELCEIISNLHSEGISCGCLGFNCFYLNKHRHVILDLNEVLVLSRKLKEVSEGGCTKLSNVEVLLPPQLLTRLHNGPIRDLFTEDLVNYSSDVWCLACLAIAHLTGNMEFVSDLVRSPDEDFVEFYEDWKKEVLIKLEIVLTGTKFESLMEIFESCLSYDPQNRPHAINLFCAFQDAILGLCSDGGTSLDLVGPNESSNCCLLLSNFYSVDVETRNERGSLKGNILDVEAGIKGMDGVAYGRGHDATLIGHRDCVTGLAIGGGFLFSSSYDKTINAWSLQDHSCVQTLRGHEHRIMAIISIDHISQSFCITGDAGGGIFIWKITSHLDSEVFKIWYENKDWRYSGIHSLAFSDTGYIYTGSGDKSIKAWSFQDQSLLCTMTGHKSTVSCLSVRDGILYSGSWDGTLRLWWLSDHTPLCVLGANEQPLNLAPVLSLSSGTGFIASSYENGYLKVWRNEMLVRSEKVKTGAIYALYSEQNWIFTGGWDKTVNIQEILEKESEVEIKDVASIKCDSIITSLLYCEGKLFVGLSIKEIKVDSGSMTKWGRALVDILSNDKFGLLCTLLYTNFGDGKDHSGYFDFSQINTFMKEGKYDDSPELFRHDIQQVWEKFKKIGHEMVDLATSLSCISTAAIDKLIESTELDNSRKDPKVSPAMPVRKISAQSNAVGTFISLDSNPTLDDVEHEPSQNDTCDNECCKCSYCNLPIGEWEHIKCTGCNLTYHLACVNPFTDDGTRNNTWYCSVCVSAKSIQSITEENHLISEIDAKNSPENLVETDPSEVCKICRGPEERGEALLTCGRKACAHKYYHMKCLKKSQRPNTTQANKQCWYCPSCHCHTCLDNKDDFLLVSCVGCDKAHHIYCMDTRRDSGANVKYCYRCCSEKEREGMRKHGRENEPEHLEIYEPMEMLICALESLEGQETLFN